MAIVPPKAFKIFPNMAKIWRIIKITCFDEFTLKREKLFK